MYNDNHDTGKKQKTSDLFERVNKLKEANIFSKAKIYEDGYSTFYKNPKELENAFKRATAIFSKASQTRGADCIIMFYHAYIIVIRMLVLNKGFSDSIRSLYKKVYGNLIRACDKYSANNLKDVFYYANYVIIFEQVRITALIASRSNTPKNNEAVKNIFIECNHAIRHVRDKNFKIVSLGMLEKEIKKNLPESFQKIV